MSSHRRLTKRFSRKTTAKTALIRGLVQSLVEHGRIKTTVQKAKETKRHVERAITVAKRDNLSSRRLLMSRYPHELTVRKLMDDLGKRFNTRAGGYTRVIKLGIRSGDSAQMAFIEFVDYDYKTKGEKPTDAKSKSVQTKAKIMKKSAVSEKTR